jgi:hypothetical protein
MTVNFMLTDFRDAFLKPFILKSFPVVLSTLEGAFVSHVLKITRAWMRRLRALSAIVDE